MREFGDTLKLYFKREQNLVSLSFFVAPAYVQTYYLERGEFEKVIALSPGGAHERPGFFVMRKADCLRWSFDSQGMTHQVRVDLEKWDALIDQYLSKMRDSQEPIVTCVVR